MNKYKIIDNGHEEYVVEAIDALSAITDWMRQYHTEEIIEYIAENGLTYKSNLQIIKL